MLRTLRDIDVDDELEALAIPEAGRLQEVPLNGCRNCFNKANTIETHDQMKTMLDLHYMSDENLPARLLGLL